MARPGPGEKVGKNFHSIAPFDILCPRCSQYTSPFSLCQLSVLTTQAGNFPKAKGMYSHDFGNKMVYAKRNELIRDWHFHPSPTFHQLAARCSNFVGAVYHTGPGLFPFRTQSHLQQPAQSFY